MIRNITTLLFLIFALNSFGQEESHTKVLLLMGSRFDITAVSPYQEKAQKAIEAGISEIKRIEKLISSWDPNSQTSEIIRNAGIKPVLVDQELFNLIRRSIKISELTHGAFDISYASLDKIWRFDGQMKELPDSSAVAASVAKINYKNIILNPEKRTVFLKKKGMKIGFGAIGKGYAANKALDIMSKMNLQGALVNASGDLISWGKDEGGKDWKIGIVNPKQKNKIFSWLNINETAVVTSGNYEKFVRINGQTYSHIIDPRTGYPVKGLISVSIICPNAELADALATSVFVLGKEKGLELINQLKGIECLLITNKQELFTSKNLHLDYIQKPITNHKYQIKIGNQHAK
ncbi:FAD:protein FMN transferase [Ancylomarina euxinus]|uniref:FAD:protein FMN transferase n=1 Tax=Ancylomarina euxinus TaxID=2283627 RepID=A0A425XXM2_9BACT|nr:FAD:protein FMN transferase [Ancylomarina euxinus]MCZ4694733.1 FAD:protein FMN transferase [Ancylomarina euxinus]MUP16397.1 FAD:protein FMN transferase [Ancylomarina euxinus]RRG19428.1 FAD:protein FMN transferase [Ancylomarina euxinus]